MWRVSMLSLRWSQGWAGDTAWLNDDSFSPGLGELHWP